MPEVSIEFLHALGINGYQKITPKAEWKLRLQKSMDLIYELPTELARLQSLFADELKEVIWLQAIRKDAPTFASAAYPEVPGKVFVTTALFYYVPPATATLITNTYFAFENMIHECLHHRGEKIFTASPLLRDLMKSSAKISVSWRATTWSFSHAIQAYYVYLWIFKLRQWRSNDVSEKIEIREILSQSLNDVSVIINELEIQLSQISKVSPIEFRALLAITQFGSKTRSNLF